jgi:hypothetical protein
VGLASGKKDEFEPDQVRPLFRVNCTSPTPLVFVSNWLAELKNNPYRSDRPPGHANDKFRGNRPERKN